MLKKRLTLYIDTSVIGGYFDVEFAKETQSLFDNLEISHFNIMYSSVTEDELLNAPREVKAFLETIPNNLKTK